VIGAQVLFALLLGGGQMLVSKLSPAPVVESPAVSAQHHRSVLERLAVLEQKVDDLREDIRALRNAPGR
jgi:type II secretory pathway component PulM